MLRELPFRDESHLSQAAEQIWSALRPEDWKEAFSHHPKIGEINALRAKFATSSSPDTSDWASGEQARVNEASEEILKRLAEGNALYEATFGYIFIVCATGKSAAEMLALLNERMKNDAASELRAAAAEQHKITLLRLQKLGQ
jgi:2-oxo-4-hydroxy-4-carboxy-5-ureidoimidazoline decarboxylase